MISAYSIYLSWVLAKRLRETSSRCPAVAIRRQALLMTSDQLYSSRRRAEMLIGPTMWRHLLKGILRVWRD